jgi:hypothetical protein
MNGNITEAEITMLESCNNEREWDDACDAVKKARDGQYPSDWWVRVMKSGLATQLATKWNNPRAFDITVAVPKADGSFQVIHALELENNG